MTKKKNPEDLKERGRPSNFNDSLAEKLLDLAQLGKTDAQLAEAAGVTERTFNSWKQKYPDFLRSLKEAKEVADELVEATLFERACGYSHKEIKLFLDEGRVIEHEYTRHYPPDTVAAIFWLKNRQPHRWREKQEIEHSGSVQNKLTSMSKEELQAEVAQLESILSRRKSV